MRIIGSNFSVIVSARNGVVTAADRPVRYMKGWPLARVLALAKRWDWKIQYLNEAERKQVEESGDRPQRQPA